MYLKLCDHLCANMHALYDGNEEKFKLVASLKLFLVMLLCNNTTQNDCLFYFRTSLFYDTYSFSKIERVSDKLMHLYILDGNTIWHRMF